MKHTPIRSALRPTLRHLVAAALVATAPAGFAQTSAPTSASLNATAGPLSVSTAAVTLPRGFGGGTIYHPTAQARYGVIAISPGFTATESSIAWLGRRLATHGFVVITLNTLTTLDQPDSRANQLMAALNHVINASSAAVKARIDTSRLAVAGHSMGGGGALIAARDNPTLKASYPLTPWNLNAAFSTVRVPTMIVGADGDTIAPVAVHARPFYAALPGATSKAYGELNNGTHFAPNTTNTPIGRYGVAWMKRFVDGDTRYSTFLCGIEHTRYATSLVFDRFNQNCPH